MGGERVAKGGRWVGLALVLHVLVALGIARLPAPSRPVPTASEPADLDPIDLTIDALDDSPAAVPEEGPSDVPTAADAPAARLAMRDRTTTVGTMTEMAVEPAPEQGTEAAPAGTGVTFGAPSADIGVGAPKDANRFLTTAEDRARAGREPTAAEQAAESKERVDAALRAPARARERELGLGPEGPVLTALGEGASASTSPIGGRAVFLAIADGSGSVVSIHLVECDGARPGWNDAAKLALKKLEGKKLRMPSTAKQATMKIEVTSAWKLPNGQDPGADVSVLGVPVAKGEGKQSTKVTILDPIPKIHMLKVDEHTEIPIPEVHFTIFATDGDPSNIGAAARRIVHTRLIESSVL
jgi:hypothetical protein